MIGQSRVGPACECAYDDLAAGGEVTFSDFNAMWIAEDIEPSDPTLRAFSGAFVSCAAGTN